MDLSYPQTGWHFLVAFELFPQLPYDLRFQEVSGLTVSVETEPYKEGGENRFTYRLPSRARYGNLILKRGMLNDSGLVDWFKKAIEDFSFSPVDVQVFLLNEQHERSASWVFMQAYPVKWVISDLKAMENSLAVETIELAYQYYRRT